MELRRGSNLGSYIVSAWGVIMLEWSYIDLYCGGGGLSQGAKMAGGTHVAGLDNDHDSGAVAHYNQHFSNPEQFVEGFDLNNSPSDALRPLLPKHGRWILIGGPPCKGFSIAGLEDPEDERSKHVQNFMQVVKDLNPPGFFFENVPNIFGLRNQKPKDVHERIQSDPKFKALKTYTEKFGYTVSAHVLIASEYGTPQNRIRVFFMGTKNGNSVEEPPSTHHLNGKSDSKLPSSITVKQALSDLPKKLGKVPIEYDSQPTNEFQKWARAGCKAVTGHLDTKHSQEIKEKIEKTPYGKSAMNYNHSWVKFHPDKPANTIKMNNRAPGLHWERNQSLSPRECARLQGFPDRYKLIGTKTQMLNVIGNAVPPQLSSAVCRTLVKALGWKKTKS